MTTELTKVIAFPETRSYVVPVRCIHVFHSDFPEFWAEGQTLAEATRRLVQLLSNALSGVGSQGRRDALQQALTEVLSYAERNKNGEPSTEQVDPGRGNVPCSVLVVEDEELTRHAIARLLHGWAYTILEAPDGGSALDQVRTLGESLNVIILDILLPDLNGVKVAQHIRAVRPDLPIVACSAALNTEFEAELRRLGVREIVSKPFRVETLHSALLRVA